MKKYMLMTNEENNSKLTSQILSNDYDEIIGMLSQMWSRGKNVVRMYEYNDNGYGDFAYEPVYRLEDSEGIAKIENEDKDFNDRFRKIDASSVSSEILKSILMYREQLKQDYYNRLK